MTGSQILLTIPLTPLHVRNGPIIYSGFASFSGGVTEKGYILIRDLWKEETDIIHNMRVVNTYALS